MRIYLKNVNECLNQSVNSLSKGITSVFKVLKETMRELCSRIYSIAKIIFSSFNYRSTNSSFSLSSKNIKEETFIKKSSEDLTKIENVVDSHLNRLQLEETPQLEVKEALSRPEIDQFRGFNKEDFISEKLFTSDGVIDQGDRTFNIQENFYVRKVDFSEVFENITLFKLNEFTKKCFNTNLSYFGYSQGELIPTIEYTHQDIFEFYQKSHTDSFLSRNKEFVPGIEKMIKSMISNFSPTERKRFVTSLNMLETSWADQLREFSFDSIFFQASSISDFNSSKKWYSTQQQVNYLSEQVDWILERVEGEERLEEVFSKFPFLETSRTGGYYKYSNEDIRNIVGELRERVGILQSSIASFQHVELPMYYHATPDNTNALSIMQTQVEVRHEKAFRGAFVSTEHESSYGKYVFAFPTTLGLEGENVERYINQGGNRFWIGFDEGLDVSRGGGEVQIIYFICGGSLEERLKKSVELSDKYHINMGAIAVVSPEVANLEREILYKLRGLPFPKHFDKHRR